MKPSRQPLAGAWLAALLLSGCAAPLAPKNDSAAPEAATAAVPVLQRSSLETHGPLELPFDSLHRWLYFPMYERDTAHAVDLAALRWRPDTLLASATRYPLHAGETWPQEALAQARYVYATRLIDCRTGRHADLGEGLVARDGTVLFERPLTPAQIERQLRTASAGGRWPNRTEIGLACFAASDPALLRQRQEAALAPVAPLSWLPTTTVLADAQAWLGRQVAFRPDLAAARAAHPATAEDVLRVLDVQYAQWRRAASGPATAPAPPLPWEDSAAARGAINERLKRRTFHNLDMGLELQGQGRFADWVGTQDKPALPEGVAKRDEWTPVVARILGSCASGVTVNARYRWLSDDNDTLAERPATAAEALASVRLDEQRCGALASVAQSLGLAPEDHRRAARDEELGRAALGGPQTPDAAQAMAALRDETLAPDARREALARALLALRSQ